MDKQQRPGRAYLLRLWPTITAGQTIWRASLEHIPTGERLGFATLEQLFVFLMQQTEQASQEQDGSAQEGAQE